MPVPLSSARTVHTRSHRHEVAAPPWDAVEWSLAYWSCCARSADIWWTRHMGPAAIAARRDERLASLVRLARNRSPFYRSLYRRVAPDRTCLEELPVVTKPELMSHFDEWVTDPGVRLADVQRFLDDRRHIGEQFVGRYYVWKSSGSTGIPGIYIHDADALATYDALMMAQIDLARWSADYATRMLRGNGRAALIVATGDHFASIASWQRASRANPALQARSFSVLQPLPQLVRELNEYQPAFLASYPTVLCLLAEEQNAGRLHVAPASLWSGGECLAAAAHAAIEGAFGCPLSNEYGASECLSIAFECAAGWLHVNADWVLLEPVDSDYRAVAPGVASHTVLLTNLINRVQPIIRYDLGDSIAVAAQPCACGNPLPAIQVEGRRDETLSLRSARGHLVRLLPMALSTVIEEGARLHRFQIVQTGPDHLAIRLDKAQPQVDLDRAWNAVARALGQFLNAQGLANVTLSLDDRPPVIDRPGGKLRVTIDQRARDTSRTSSSGQENRRRAG